MQRAQENYRIGALAALVLVALIFAGKTAFSAGMADGGKPDILLGGPILNPQADGPCDPVLALPDVTPGTDVDGHQIASADLAAPSRGPLMARCLCR